MMKSTAVAVLVALFLGPAGCIAGTVHRRDLSPNLISPEEIRAADAATVYELVRAHHPEWLRGRGRISLVNPEPVAVYLDNTRMGGPEILRRIKMTGITSVRYLSAAEAQLRFGPDHAHGAIIISR